MAGKARYTDEQKDEFIELAQLKGIAPAIRELKYPTYPAAQKWFKERDLDMPTIDTLMQKAADMRVFYGDNEKKYALQVTIDAIVEKVQNNDLDADELNKASNALAKLIQTFQLIEGKSTAITETHKKDGTDLGAIDLINAAKARNSLKEAELS